MKRVENIIALSICLVFGAFGLFLAKNEEAPQNSQLEVHFLNVGQGDAILFEKDSRQTLVDVGPDVAILSELGKVMPFNDKNIETIIITHPHTDHLGGISSILQAYTVDKIYFNGMSSDSPLFNEFLTTAKNRKIPLERLYKGKSIRMDSLDLDVLWPPEAVPITNDPNETSLVIMASSNQAKILLTGDAPAVILESLILEETDILKVSHHGSKTGTSKNFLEEIKPQYAVYLVGQNSYGHPAPSVMRLLSGIKSLRTDQAGTISFWTDGADVFLY